MSTATVGKRQCSGSETPAARLLKLLWPCRKGSLLDEAMPVYDFHGSVSVVTHATPQQIFKALYEVTLSDMPVAYALGSLRYLPMRLAGRTPMDSGKDQPFVDLLRAGGTVVLAQEWGREVVLGSAGKYHQLLDQEWVPFRSPEEFVRFHDPAYQKLAIAIRVEPGSNGEGYRVTIEHRTHALSAESRRKFGWYWLVIKPTGNFVSLLLLRAIRRRAERMEP